MVVVSVCRMPWCVGSHAGRGFLEVSSSGFVVHDYFNCEKARRLDVLHPSETVFLVGVGTCGLSAGAGVVFDALREEVKNFGGEARVVETGCMGFCFAEPLVEVRGVGNVGVIYSRVGVEDVPGLVRDSFSKKVFSPKAFALRGACNWSGCERVPRISSLKYGWYDVPVVPSSSVVSSVALQRRDALENCGLIDPNSLEEYLSVGGYYGLWKALCLKPEEVVERVKSSGLRGRGGAGFSTGLKWELCRKAVGGEKFVVCNADEGDPGAFMNRANLEGDPHKVLEGLIIAGYAVGARKGFVYVRAEKPLAAKMISQAVSQAREKGFLGENILGKCFDFDVEVRLGAGAFVCGEETALIASIEGKRGMPKARPPYPVEKGLWGCPTLINNVETLAHVPNIFAREPHFFSGAGSEKSRGTKVFCMTGRVERTGAFEVPIGITLRQLIFEVGGGIPGKKRFKAAQTGGPSGGCLPDSCLDLPLDYESLNQAGSIMGSGGLVVMDEDSCMVDVAKYFLSFTQQESCGQCLPCREGTSRMLEIISRISEGRGCMEDLVLLEKLAKVVKETSLCGLGQTAPNPILSTLKYFRNEYEAHIKEKKCPSGVCRMH